MRYLIESIEDEGVVGQKIIALEKAGKIRIIEKSDPLEVMKVNLHRIQRSMDILEKAGIDKEVIAAYIYAKMPSGMRNWKLIGEVLSKQQDFFKKLGVRLK